MSTIYLCSLPFLDTNNTITIDFENKESQTNYFIGRNTDIIPSVNIQNDGERTTVTIKRTISELQYADYLFFLGDDGNYQYYFITNKVYKNANSTVLELKLDVMQTYMFRYYWLDSLVDRCHVERWKPDGTPTDNLEDEEIQPTSLIRTENKMLKKMKNNIIYVTSEPIEFDGGGGGGEGPSSGHWQEGVPSKELFRYLKGYEGFAPYLYNDSGGVPTIGYGITNSEPSSFNKLKENQPCSEELCAQEVWKILPEKYGKPIVNAVKSLGCTTQQQFDALIDLSYNAGIGRITNPDGELSKAIKRDPLDESYIRPIWEKYIIKNELGNVEEGLKLRRKAECDIYFKGVYEKRKIPKLGQGGSITGSFDGDGWIPS